MRTMRSKDGVGGRTGISGPDSEQALEGLLRLRVLGASNTVLVAVALFNCAVAGRMLATIGMALLFAASAQFVLSRRTGLAERNDRALLMMLTGPCMNLLLFFMQPGFNIMRTNWMLLILYHALLCSVGFSLPPMHSLVHLTFCALAFGFLECQKLCELAAHQQQHAQPPLTLHLEAHLVSRCSAVQLFVLTRLLPIFLSALAIAAAAYTSALPSDQGFAKSLSEEEAQSEQHQQTAGECATPGMDRTDTKAAAEPAVPLESLGLRLFSSLRLVPLMRRYHACALSLVFVIQGVNLLSLLGLPVALYYAWALIIVRIKSAPLDTYVSPEGLLLCMSSNFIIGRESSKLNFLGVLKHVQHQLVASQSLLMDQLPAHIVRAVLSRMSTSTSNSVQGQTQDEVQQRQQQLQQLQQEDEEGQQERETRGQEEGGPGSDRDEEGSGGTCSNQTTAGQLQTPGRLLDIPEMPFTKRSATCPDPLTTPESLSEHSSIDAQTLGSWPVSCDAQQPPTEDGSMSVGRGKPSRQSGSSVVPLLGRRHSSSTVNMVAPFAGRSSSPPLSAALQSKPELQRFATMGHAMATYLRRATEASRELSMGLISASSAQCVAMPCSGAPQGVQVSSKSFSAVDTMERDVFIANHESVTLYVSDICGFSTWSGKVEPSKVLKTIDALYTRLDDVILKEFPNLYKIETVGDAYIVAANMLLPDPDHAATAVRFAVRAQEEASKVPRPDVDDGSTLQMRIGLHSGSISSGIVGKIRRRYVVYGDAMNLASRTETTCPPGCIQLTAATYTLAAPALDSSIALARRGEVQIKGREEPVLMYMANRCHRGTSRCSLDSRATPAQSPRVTFN